MAASAVKLKDVCSVKMGYPMSRAKALDETRQAAVVKVLMPSAMSEGFILERNLATERVYIPKNDFFTRASDIILKLSTPYNCAYITEEHEGILVTSFAVIIRSKDPHVVDARYLAAFFNTSQAKKAFQSMGTGTVMPMLKKGLLEDMLILLPDVEEQRYLAELFDNTHKRKIEYHRMVELSDMLLESELVRRIV